MFGNSAWIIGDKLIRVAVGLFVTGWMSRYLGPTGFGEYGFSLALVSFLSVGVSFGLDGVLARDVSCKPQEAGTILGQALILRTCGALVAFLLTQLYVMFYAPFASVTVLLCSLTLLVQIFDIYEVIYHTRLESRRVVLYRFVGFSFATLARIYLLLNQGSVAQFAAVLAVEGFVGIFLIFGSLRLQGLKTRIFPLDLVLLRTLLRQSGPLLLFSLTGMFILRADLLVLEHFTAVREIGIFSISPKILELMNTITVAVVGSSLPLLSQASAEERVSIARSLFRVMAILSWIMVFGAIVTADPMLPLIFGSEYQESVGPFRIYVLSFLVSTSVATRNAVLMVAGDLWSLAGVTLLSALCALIVYPFAAKTGDLGLMAGAVLFVHLSSFLIFPMCFKSTRWWMSMQLRSLIGMK